MGDSGLPASAVAEARLAPPPQGSDPRVLLEAMRARGAERFDPVGFRFIEALARRSAAHRDAARRVLDHKLARALADYVERFDRAEDRARETLARSTARSAEAAEAAEALTRCYDGGDCGGLQRLLANPNARGGNGPLADLLAHIGRHTAAGPAGELASLRHFRSTWSRLSVERQLSSALAQAPENAGPLNSHFLVLQSLTLMRDIAPDYLEQFMSYVDALLWLDQADNGRNAVQKNPVRGERDKKRKSGRGSAG